MPGSGSATLIVGPVKNSRSDPNNTGSGSAILSTGNKYWYLKILVISDAEPPLFLATPGPEVRGPGADSGSDQIGSAPAPGKNRRLRVHTLTFLILSS